MSETGKNDKIFELAYSIQQKLESCDTISDALNMGVDTLVSFIYSQFEDPLERCIVIHNCINRMFEHQDAEARKIK